MSPHDRRETLKGIMGATVGTVALGAVIYYGVVKFLVYAAIVLLFAVVTAIAIGVVWITYELDRYYRRVRR